MINLEEFRNWGLDAFNEALPARPYVEHPDILGDDGQ